MASFKASAGILVACLIASVGICQPAPAPASKIETPFSAASITTLLEKVNRYQTEHPVKNKSDRNWERGTWFTGVMAAGAATGDTNYFEQAWRFGEEQQWQPGTEKSGGNVLTCTQTYLELYFLKHDRACIAPVIAWLDSGKPNTPSGAKVWYLEGGRRYADSLYVGAPALAMLAKATGDQKYLDWMNAFFWDVQAELFDAEAGLFYRDARFIGTKTVNGKKIFWSRGNGWAFASLPRILACLPENDSNRPKFVALFKQMAVAIAKQQQPDGLWRANLGDAAELPAPESSGSGFFCYGMSWGIRNGLLDRKTFLPIVRKAWVGLTGCVSEAGMVRFGQPVGDRPVAVNAEDTHEYVTGAFLLAGSEVLRLVNTGVLSAKED